MSDEKSQILAAVLLDGVAGVSVRKTGWGPIHYLSVACATVAQAQSIERYLRSIDHGAVRAATDAEVA